MYAYVYIFIFQSINICVRMYTFIWHPFSICMRMYTDMSFSLDILLAYGCICMYTVLFSHWSGFIYTYKYVCIYIYMHIHVHSALQSLKWFYIYMHICMYVCMYVCMYIHTHNTHTHTHIHIHIHMYSSKCLHLITACFFVDRPDINQWIVHSFLKYCPAYFSFL